MKNIKITLLACLPLFGIMSSCNDFLDESPKSEIAPEDYFNTDEQLLTYTTTLYPSFIVTHSSISGNNAGTFILDDDTDNQADRGPSVIWSRDEYKVPTDKGAWNFDRVRTVNYFFSKVLPKLEAGKISGSKNAINQAVGEAYFFRASAYFDLLKKLGDLPIITQPLPDNQAELVEQSKRKPRNEVARFILSDLDKATELLLKSPVSSKNRVSKEVAQLLRSRVALFEGTWLKHHKGTPFVPGGPDWPGFKLYPSFTLDIDSEIDFFLQEAMKSAEYVADKVALTPNNNKLEAPDLFTNPYYMMFADVNMAKYSEVLLWKSYSTTYGVTHVVQPYLRLGANSGYTRGLVESFLMKNGLPRYAPGSYYRGDDFLSKVVENRDQRLRLFMKVEGDRYVPGNNLDSLYIFGKPDLLAQGVKSSTGYDIKKGLYPDKQMMINSNVPGYTGSIAYRAAEAYLNYIEAQYEKEHTLNAKSINYWKQIRKRAGVNQDIQKTINNTDLSKENDWAIYSKGQLVDETLYNIRRERRCELIAEGFRMDDLRRWRALDNIDGYQIEGFKLWGPMKAWYEDSLETTESVSDKSLSPYLRIYQIQRNNNNYFNGLVFNKAHYLSPIAFEEIQLASPTSDANNSNIYQNPGWPVQAGGTAAF
ncbi:RagB/SusD family nutrient uptake outer membrane protein [Ornithobacterium rhinotracheale]|uniref:RagB/SusD family nutrient uptake outer membrane protein n=1 Tax=Ornithobacterium rhinotracheale TaxID=28251 RepID=UPI0040358504